MSLVKLGGRAPYVATPDSVALDLFTGGTFTRSTEGSYLTGPATDGSSAFLAWAVANARRLEYDTNLPGGTGLLMEGARTNLALRSEAWDVAPWALTTGWSADVAAPDAVVDANLRSWAASEIDNQNLAGLATTTQYTWSFYHRLISGDPAIRAEMRDFAGNIVTTTTDAAAVWARIERQQASATGASTPYVAHRKITNVGQVAVWGAQMEAGFWPTSYVRTAGSSVLRAADALTYTVTQYPASFRTAGFRFTWVPLMSSAELIAGGGPLRMASFNTAQNYLEVLNSGGLIAVRAVEANTPRVTRTPITFSRFQPITITVRPSAGQITVAGATTGNGTTTGTPFNWPAGTLTWGANTGGSGPAMGRFGRFVEAP